MTNAHVFRLDIGQKVYAKIDPTKREMIVREQGFNSFNEECYRVEDTYKGTPFWMWEDGFCLAPVPDTQPNL
jgi:hypothetical protein